MPRGGGGEEVVEQDICRLYAWFMRLYIVWRKRERKREGEREEREICIHMEISRISWHTGGGGGRRPRQPQQGTFARLRTPIIHAPTCESDATIIRGQSPIQHQHGEEVSQISQSSTTYCTYYFLSLMMHSQSPVLGRRVVVCCNRRSQLPV